GRVDGWRGDDGVGSVEIRDGDIRACHNRAKRRGNEIARGSFEDDHLRGLRVIAGLVLREKFGGREIDGGRGGEVELVGFDGGGIRDADIDGAAVDDVERVDVQDAFGCGRADDIAG